jgi:hypothetical protein
MRYVRYRDMRYVRYRATATGAPCALGKRLSPKWVITGREIKAACTDPHNFKGEGVLL